MRKLLIASVATFTCAFGLAWLMPPLPTPYCEIEVITDGGDAYVAGSGDTCADAWYGAVIPEDWREVRSVVRG